MDVTKVSILLTTTVNVIPHSSIQVDPAERLHLYLKAVRQWLTCTDFKIVLVENSGYTFPELEEERRVYAERFEIISFHQLDDMTRWGRAIHLHGKGGLEIESVHYAFTHSTLLPASRFIIKITGRFFVPAFQEYVRSVNLETYDCMGQHYNCNIGPRCEIVGTHIKNFYSFFDRMPWNGEKIEFHVESVYKYRCTLYPAPLTLPLFDIEPTQRGGYPGEYTSL